MIKDKTIVILWLRQDLRVDDHPALNAACRSGHVIPVYILSDEEEGDWPFGAASRWWLHHSLQALQKDLKRLGLPLIFRKGKTLPILFELVNNYGAQAVFWSRRYEPSSLMRDAHVKRELKAKGIDAQSFNSALLYEPWTIANKQGKPFQVFTPFWKACLNSGEPESPRTLQTAPQATTAKGESSSLEELQLLPTIDWAKGLKEEWIPGSAGAAKRLKDFIAHAANYINERDFPALDGVSCLSPHLHFGEISPRMIWHALKEAFKGRTDRIEGFLRQLGWREFAHHLLFHFPETPDCPLRKDFLNFSWKKSPKMLKAWQSGRTGYPLVDAGMRQLWHTGWMHNRVRMVVGSFLVKDLLINWTEGASWFWDTLVDADLANNTLGWQWVGGCGADAAPYFRVFNPVTQSEKFDPDGEYIRRWVPELSKLPNRWIHKPWEAPPLILREAGLTLGKEYPYPIVDHSKAREEALKAYSAFKE